MKPLLTLTLLLSALCAQGQDLLDANGKRHGRWTVWMDANWKDVKDSTQAHYARYVHFDNGELLQMLNPIRQKDWKQEYEAQTAPLAVDSKLVHGRYSWYGAKGNLICVQEFNNGEPVSIDVYRANGSLDMRVDYTKRWMEQPNTAFVATQEKSGAVESYFWRKAEPTGWRSWPADKEPDSIAVEVTKEIGDSTFVVVRHYFKGKLDKEAGKIFLKGKGRGVTDGIYHGAYRAWFGNGQRENEGQYHYGKQVGEWKHWNREGTETVRVHPAVGM